VDRLKARVAEIDRDAAKVQPREFADPGGAPLKPALVDFRPPMLKVTDKKVAVTFVMLHDRVYFYQRPKTGLEPSRVVLYAFAQHSVVQGDPLERHGGRHDAPSLASRHRLQTLGT
jgi:hypothetical protein